MLDFLILYEHRQRELNNSCLLKVELERRGYKVKLACIYNAEHKDIIQPFYFMKPRVVIVPWLYGNKEIDKIRNLFKDAEFHIVDLQCEQVLSEKWIHAGYHFPKERAKDAYHVCWGEVSYKRLESLGVKSENLFLSGALSTDFDRDEFLSLFYTKNELAKKYNLRRDKKWLLFLSSFTFTNMTEEELQELQQRTNVNNDNFREAMIESKKIITKWLLDFAKRRPDYEIIYRPHPNEKEDVFLKSLFQGQFNIHIISDFSVAQWIYVGDYINNWISTSMVDAVFMKKDTCLLRPVAVDKWDDSELFENIHRLKTYEEFCDFNEGLSEEGSIIDISKYYFQGEKPSYVLLSDFLEHILANKKIFTGKHTGKINYIKSILAYSCNYVNFFVRFIHNESLSAIHKEIYKVKNDQKKLEKKIREIINEGGKQF